MKSFLRRVLNKIDRTIVLFASKSKILSNLYYNFVSKSFMREHQAVLAGKAKYLSELKNSKLNYYMLIRNTHRIEKGLLMKPRKDTFAKGYIEETLDGFINLVHTDSVDKKSGQVKWFCDVLTEYFRILAGTDDYIDSLHEKFKHAKLNGEFNFGNSESDYIPYTRDIASDDQCSYEQFFDLCKQRRSVRWFENRKVPRELVDKAIHAAAYSPSACNRQPFEYRVIDDDALLEKVVELPMGSTGYAHNIPMMIVCVGNLDAYFSERDRHLIYIDGSLANMSLMFALETLGLSSCPINWPDIEEKEVKIEKLLKLKPYQRPIMCLAVGYPDRSGKVAYSSKKDLDMLRRYN
ncbi:nitroreductase family protein [Rhodohalobacter sulfatireducens]|uniref:Nitroreductase family protein n=1 Tax=Rhodohalobacter sulfatireducens TaxID=2911366 RepID=A0ABS9KIW7_9BACT|nr:nitroreductase family protein [Rhodohalobacter sulfatireducens]MCG2590774.1 nitroreductase family protein [Rhodohalobacter sulfatireducens]